MPITLHETFSSLDCIHSMKSTSLSTTLQAKSIKHLQNFISLYEQTKHKNQRQQNKNIRTTWLNSPTNIIPSRCSSIQSERNNKFPRILLIRLDPNSLLLHIHIISDRHGLLVLHIRHNHRRRRRGSHPNRITNRHMRVVPSRVLLMIRVSTMIMVLVVRRVRRRRSEDILALVHLVVRLHRPWWRRRGWRCTRVCTMMLVMVMPSIPTPRISHGTQMIKNRN